DRGFDQPPFGRDHFGGGQNDAITRCAELDDGAVFDESVGLLNGLFDRYAGADERVACGLKEMSPLERRLELGEGGRKECRSLTNERVQGRGIASRCGLATGFASRFNDSVRIEAEVPDGVLPAGDTLGGMHRIFNPTALPGDSSGSGRRLARGQAGLGQFRLYRGPSGREVLANGVRYASHGPAPVAFGAFDGE